MRPVRLFVLKAMPWWLPATPSPDCTSVPTRRPLRITRQDRHPQLFQPAPSPLAPASTSLTPRSQCSLIPS